MKLSRPVLLNSALAVVIIAAATGVYFIANPITAETAAATQLTGTVQEGAVSSTITASGSIAAKREVSASFTVSGTIKTVNVAIGDTVEKGDKLGTLATSDLKDARTKAYTTQSRAITALANANEALSDAEDAEAEADDSSSTSAAGSTSTGSSAQSVSSATTAVESAQDQLDTANDAVDDAEDAVDAATLKAPISGLVIAVSGEVGGTASAGSTSSSAGASTDSTTTTTSSSGFVTIADVSKYTVSASIAEADIALVAKGQSATISFPALDDVTAAAKVTTVAPTATASNSVVTYATTITLSKIPDGLRLGQTAEIAITTESSADDALYVPTAAITTGTDGTSTVKVVGDDDVTTSVTVETGVVGDDGTEITSGLTAGQTVVLGTVAAATTTDSGTTNQQGGGGTGGFGGGTGGTGGGAPSGGFPGGGN